MNMTVIEKLMEDGSALKDRAEKAEACAAEMRALLGDATKMLANYNAYWPADRQVFYSHVQQRCDSTSFGVGWLSPEKVAVLQRDLDILKAERELDVKQKQIMREALEKLKQITEKGAYLNPLPRTTIRDIVLEALAKLKGQ